MRDELSHINPHTGAPSLTTLHLGSKARLPKGHSLDQGLARANMHQAKIKPHFPQRLRCCTPLSPDIVGLGGASTLPMGTQESFGGVKQLPEPHRQNINSVPKKSQPVRLHLGHPNCSARAVTVFLTGDGKGPLPPYKESGRR